MTSCQGCVLGRAVGNWGAIPLPPKNYSCHRDIFFRSNEAIYLLAPRGFQTFRLSCLVKDPQWGKKLCICITVSYFYAKYKVPCLYLKYNSRYLRGNILEFKKLLIPHNGVKKIMQLHYCFLVLRRIKSSMYLSKIQFRLYAGKYIRIQKAFYPIVVRILPQASTYKLSNAVILLARWQIDLFYSWFKWRCYYTVRKGAFWHYLVL